MSREPRAHQLMFAQGVLYVRALPTRPVVGETTMVREGKPPTPFTSVSQFPHFPSVSTPSICSPASCNLAQCPIPS